MGQHATDWEIDHNGHRMFQGFGLRGIVKLTWRVDSKTSRVAEGMWMA
jgi:hypothetical protein